MKIGESMKKYIWVTMILICLCACGKKEPTKTVEERKYEEAYIETIPKNAEGFIEQLKDDNIILTTKQIDEYNQEISSKTNSIYEIDAIEEISTKERKEYIESYKLPSMPKYHNNLEITKEQLTEILNNRNIENIGMPIQKGIIVKRANLKSFPTHMHFYNKPNENNFDTLQETALSINTPVLIIHESLDKEWYFVISKTYRGWVLEKDVALAKESDFDFFIKNNKFGIITEPFLEVEDALLDMGVKLPYVGLQEEGYQFALPKRGEDKYVVKQIITIDRAKSHIGYLPYTKKSIYMQAFKYMGIKYGWGDMENGVDCSSYIANIYKTFGFLFPRNTSSQKESVGDIISLNNLSPKEKLEALNKNYPALIYQPGHVMLYLGVLDGKHYIIHASGETLKVTYGELNESSYYLKQIDRIITVD